MEILDDQKFDFYVHIDKKSHESGEYLLDVCEISNVFLTERIPVFWGHWSQTKAAMILLKSALDSTTPYDYYHLISSVDMPLKTPDEINHFFEENKGTEFVRYWTVKGKNPYNRRMTYRYPFLTWYRRNKYEIVNNMQKLVYTRILRFPRKKNNIVTDQKWQVEAGDLWWSISDKLARALADREQEMMPYWEDCYVSDETYVQTQLKHMPELSTKQSNFQTREIDWSRGKPYIWRMDDVDELLASKAMFARKFDPTNKALLDFLRDTIMERKIRQ